MDATSDPAAYQKKMRQMLNDLKKWIDEGGYLDENN
jgi:hypothetical protein